MTRSVPFLLSLSLLIAGCGEGLGPELLGFQHEAVVNGQPHSGHPSAGKLTTGSSLCTATLIGKKTVITAAHCVSPGYSHTFTVGGTAYKSAKAVRHPSYNSYQITYDIAVVILQSEPTVAPAAVTSTAPAVGQEITIVGYGKTSEYISDAGVKRMAKSTIAELTQTRLRIPASNDNVVGNICNGDSGGPSYATVNGQEVQVGVHSTKSGACGSGGHDTRVDIFMDWITQESGGDVNDPGTQPPPPPPPPADTAPPAVAITHPAAGATVGKSVTVRTQVTDNKGVTKIELLVDGSVVAQNDGKTLDFPVTLQPGNRVIRVVGHDAAGNRGEALVSVTVKDDAAPDPTPAPTPDPSPAPTPAPGAFGSECQTADDCGSGMCADDQTLGRRYCTEMCGTDLSCPAGSTCYEAGNGAMVCGLDTSEGGGGSSPPGGNNLDGQQLLGSCSVSGSDPASALWWVLLLGLWWLRRSR